jgi:hypothetical protein
MSIGRIRLDFQRAPRRVALAGPLMLASGVLGMATVLVVHQQISAEVAGIELQLGGAGSLAFESRNAAGPDPAVEAARATAAELATPWSLLLDDLESATVDSDGSVALLEVEPDRERGKVKVVAEARSLAAALGYLERLQRSQAVTHPLLESHEVRTDVRERPVRVSISADWRVRS